MIEQCKRTVDCSRSYEPVMLHDMAAITASKLRQDIYRLLDEVLETGIPLEIQRKGQRLRLAPIEPRSKLDRLELRPDFFKGDPEDLVHLDWSNEWKP